MMPALTPAPDRSKRRRGHIFVIVVLTIMLGLAMYVLATRGYNEVDCGGHTMQPGDTCQTRLYGVIPLGTKSYDAQKSIGYWEMWALVAFAIIGIGDSSRRLLRVRRESKKS
jgi:hypothetical protein